MGWEHELDQWVAEKLPALALRSDEPMSRHTSFRIGGGAKRMAFPKTISEVTALLTAAQELGAHPFLLGNGTNLLAPDEGLDRLVVSLTELREITLGENGMIVAQSGVTLLRLAEFACRQGLTGLEFAHGIPGTLGGAVYMNGGAYGGEMSHVVTEVLAWSAKDGLRTMKPQELNFGYRHSYFMEHPDTVILQAALHLESGEEDTIRAAMRELMARRRATQPLEYPSAGSAFQRPEGHFAGTLIEQCGLKGLTIGGAQVSEKHAGFLINLGGATSADVEALIAQIQHIVLEQTGVLLEPEIRVIH